MEFVFSVKPAKTTTEHELWCVFREDSLLVRLDGSQARLPGKSEVKAMHIDTARTLYLGTLDGVACFTAEVALETEPPPGLEFYGLRELFGRLEERLFWLSGHAVQIKNWDRDHRFCGRCGSQTVDETDERSKLCLTCGLKSFPRISPATITAVEREGHILLARARRFQRVLYSVIAGFVEPGETLEECVEREIYEETGIEVQNIRYFGSQPWPFPNSLMIAFTAEYRSGEIRIEQSEIVDAGWFVAGNLPPIPDRVSIARRLIDWFVETHGDI
jgi:NAD+ diphosphatase